MRTAQKLWYQFKNKKDLKDAKLLERKVDSIIKNYNVIEVIPPNQLDLFEGKNTDF